MTTTIDVGLPKWPQMLTYGPTISRDLAAEIIRRTDMFFIGYGGNDHDWDERTSKLLGMPQPFGYARKPADFDWQAHYAAENKWREEWGYLDTSYVHNQWMSSCFIGGPHGWCHPDGKIQYFDNIGKWPSVEEVRADWATIAAAFPQLDLTAVLMSGESCEEDEPVIPLVVFDVKQGEVTVSLPEGDPFARHGLTLTALRSMTPSVESLMGRFGLPASLREHGLPQSIIDGWAAAHVA